jgi:hypothetical protein
MADIPEEAVTAAAQAVGNAMITRQSTSAIAFAALESAWPHILTAMGKLASEDDCRRLMQEAFDAQKSRLMDEVAKVTDNRLEQLARVVRAAERGRFAEQITGLQLALERAEALVAERDDQAAELRRANERLQDRLMAVGGMTGG